MNEQGQGIDLGSLFGQALEALAAHREEINALDGQNGNHGDNMVENMRVVTRALREKKKLPPADALRHASQRLQSEGRGGTSQYYARGLDQAAAQFQGRPALEKGDVASLVQTLMGAIPAEGHPQPSQTAQTGGSILDVLGLLGGQQAQSQPQPQQQQEDGVDLGDVLGVLIPAGMAFLQAKQSGADTQTAIGQALMGALMGGQVNPLQAKTPRAAAGGVIAQSLLQALMK